MNKLEELDKSNEDLEELNGFGMRLAKLINNSDLNDRQLSIFIGKSDGYINKIINGETFPTLKSFVIICRALKITPEEFFRYEDDDPVTTNELIRDISKLNYKQKNIFIALLRKLLFYKSYYFKFLLISFINSK